MEHDVWTSIHNFESPQIHGALWFLCASHSKSNIQRLLLNLIMLIIPVCQHDNGHVGHQTVQEETRRSLSSFRLSFLDLSMISFTYELKPSPHLSTTGGVWNAIMSGLIFLFSSYTFCIWRSQKKTRSVSSLICLLTLKSAVCSYVPAPQTPLSGLISRSFQFYFPVALVSEHRGLYSNMEKRNKWHRVEVRWASFSVCEVRRKAM